MAIRLWVIGAVGCCCCMAILPCMPLAAASQAMLNLYAVDAAAMAGGARPSDDGILSLWCGAVGGVLGIDNLYSINDLASTHLLGVYSGGHLHFLHCCVTLLLCGFYWGGAVPLDALLWLCTCDSFMLANINKATLSDAALRYLVTKKAKESVFGSA